MTVEPIELWQPIAAPHELLWHACSTAEGLALWQADTVDGTVEAGRQLTLSWPDLGASVLLDVIDKTPPERLVLENGDNRVEIAALPEGVVLRHAGLTPSDDRAGFESSWRIALALLRCALEKHPGKRRHVSWFVRPAPATAEAAYAMFTDEAALGTWLTDGGGIPETGSRYALALKGAGPMTGEVLLRAPSRDVVLEWTERDAAVVLRTMPSPLDHDERLIALAVSRFGETTRIDEGFWENTLLRLTRVLSQGGAA